MAKPNRPRAKPLWMASVRAGLAVALLLCTALAALPPRASAQNANAWDFRGLKDKQAVVDRANNDAAFGVFARGRPQTAAQAVVRSKLQQ